MKKNLKQRWKKLCADMKPMGFWQKLDHLWTYYKTEMYIALLLLMVAAMIATGIVNRNQKVRLSGVVVNHVSLDAYSYLSDGYYLHAGPEGGEVQISNVIYTDPTTNKNIDDTYNYTLQVIAMVEAKTLDYLVMDRVGLEGFMSQDFFMDLRLLLTEQELQRWEDALIYMQYDDTGEVMPVAICLDETDFGTRFPQEGSRYIAFVANTTRQQTCLDFWDYLVGE